MNTFHGKVRLLVPVGKHEVISRGREADDDDDDDDDDEGLFRPAKPKGH